MSDREAKIVAGLVYIGAFFLGTYVDTQLWGWFIVPVFAAPALTFWQAAGVCVTAKMFIGVRSGKSRDTWDLEDAFVTVAALLAIWGIAWLIHLGAMP